MIKKHLLYQTLILLLSYLVAITSLHAAEEDNTASQKPLKIVRITPKGDDVPSGRQVLFEFNQPVVPVGKMSREANEIPITITPALQCQWRWLNRTSLACELGDQTALKLATRYQIVVNPGSGITTESGQTLKEAVKHEFITQRPTVENTSFKTWRSPGMPDIVVLFSQSVKRDSVQAHLYFQLPKKKRIPVEVKIAPPEEETEGDDSEEGEHNQAQAKETTETDQNITESGTWLISPQQELPLDSPVELRVESGIVSVVGDEPGAEDKTAVEFRTFPKFTFLGVRCFNLKNEEVLYEPNDKTPLSKRDNVRCNPLREISLQFSSPVLNSVAKQQLKVVPDLRGGRTDYNPWESLSDYSNLDQPYEKDKTYTIWLPEILKAYTTYRLSAAPEEFKDEFGRALPDPIDIKFLTDHREPNYVFEHPVSVLEKNIADSELPIYVTNLEKINLNYSLLTPEGWTEERTHTIEVPKIQDVAFKLPFKVRELIAKSSGAIQGSFKTVPPVPSNGQEPTWFFSQVTPFHVLAKVGHHNTLVWVTDFATGNPVSGVQVKIARAPLKVPNLKEVIAEGTTDEGGVALLPGTEMLDPELDHIQVYEQEKPRLFVQCQQGEDVALLPLDNDFQIRMYDISTNEEYIYANMQKKYGHISSWGTTAQGVYKVGDVVQFKLFVRDQNNRSFVLPPRETYSLKVVDPKGKVAHEVKELTLSEFGSYHGEFTIPKTAPVGWYQFELSASFTKGTWQPMRVLVSDFTPAPFRVSTVLNGELFRMGETVQVNTAATLHAGGPYANAQSAVNATISQQPFTSDSPQAKGFVFDTLLEDSTDNQTIFQTEGQVDDKGQWQASFNLPDSKVLYGKLTVESTVRDDRGKDVASSTTVSYVGRDRFVGLKETAWLLSAGNEATVKMLVVNEFGNPVTTVAIDAAVERQETKAARVKGAGNAYLTQFQHEWVAVTTCHATSDLTPQECRFTPPQAGTYRIVAKIKDSQGRDHTTTLRQWALGKGDVVWEIGPGNGLEIVPEQKRYKVGDKARYLVKNPFPGAKALVTVERLGTVKHWVMTLANSLEVVEIPVEEDFSPGFFVSVMVASPRLDKPIDANQVDLGKPAFRMGYVQTEVTDPYKEMLVDIKSDKPVYKPREQVTLDLQVKPRHPPEGEAPPVELAIAVLDEAVFDLLAQGRDYFDPYKGFYVMSELDMANFDLVMGLVGRQKFEKKGATPGGDGGLGLSLRSVFKFVSYWNPSLRPDAQGKAKVQFTVPDNLTGWRVLVLAMTPNDRMGLGEGNFKVNQPIEIRPALPNQVMSGDSFYAGFTVMNRTDKPRELQVALNASGVASIEKCEAITENCGATQTLHTEPFKRYTLWLPLKTTGDGTIELSATAKDAQEQDGLKQSLTVYKRRSLESAATYGTTTEGQATETIEFPKEIHADTGGVYVLTTPTVIGGVEGAFEYMRSYPYVCWEQKLSKGVMAAHYQSLQAYLPSSLVWEGSNTLTQQTLDLAAEFQTPSGGMAFFISKDDYVSPYLSAYTALAFNWLRASNSYVIPDAVENKLHEYLTKLLRKEELPSFYTKGMSSTIRAVALNALARHGKVTGEDIKRYFRQVKGMDLFGKAQFLSAAVQIPGTEELRDKVFDMILAQSNETSGKLSFTEKLDDGYKHLLTSSLRTQCAVLSSLLQYKAVQGREEKIGDMPFKLVRTITFARKQSGHWENTQENLFCMNALTEYARVYEKDKPNMTIQSWLDSEQLSLTPPASGTVAKFDDVKNPPITFAHAMTPQDPGRKATVKVGREGDGRLYYTVRMTFAPTEAQLKPVNAGIEVTREYSVERNGKWELLHSPMQIKSGELVRVDLYVSLPATRYFVVVDDPVPGGLEPVNRDLATSSKVAADKAQSDYAGGAFWFRFKDWHEYGVSYWSFYHQEVRQDAVRFYSDYLPVGNYHLSYVAQAIAPGHFTVMPTHTEEMFDPEVFGKGAPAVLEVSR